MVVVYILHNTYARGQNHRDALPQGRMPAQIHSSPKAMKN
jgi:hypothetical protein